MKVKRIINVIVTVIMTVVVVSVLFLAVSTKLNHGAAQIFGNKLMVVLSGSMSPYIKTGSIVGIKSVPFGSVKKGDVITFKDSSNRVVTHRAYVVEKDGITTKGDANNTIDSEKVTQNGFIGRMSFHVPYIGYFTEFAKSKAGILLFIIIPGFYLIINEIYNLIKIVNLENNKKSEAQQKV